MNGMGSTWKGLAVALLCLILYSLRSDAADSGSGETSTSPLFSSSSPTSPGLGSRLMEASTLLEGNSESSSITSSEAPKIVTDPFMLIGEDNILGPPRRKVFRRTRKRRIKKLKSTTDPSSSVADVNSSFPSSTSSSTENVMKTQMEAGTLRPLQTTTLKLEVIPLDSFDQSITEDLSASLPSPSPRPNPLSLSTTTKFPDPIFKSGHYTHHQRKRKRPSPKANLWKTPNFSVELFDTEATAEEQSTTGPEKGKSRNSTYNSASDSSNKYNMFYSKPTLLSNIPDMNSDESTNPFVNTSLPISTELQNSLQFTLQSLHPLLNSDSVLTEKEPKIPENKTVAVTHSLSDTVAKTPIAPDIRFLPTHLRKSHPLLSDDTLINPHSYSKTGPRINAHPGMHSISNQDGSTTEDVYRNRERFKTTSTLPEFTTTKSTTTASTLSTVRTSTVPITTSTSSRSPFPASVGTIPQGPHGNLKITEIVYPTVPQKTVDLLKPKPTASTETTSTRGSSPNTISSSTSGSRPTPIYDNVDSRSPPLILMGSDTSVTELGVKPKENLNSPPIFDDLLLEELVKGFVPPKTTLTTPSTTTIAPTIAPSKRTTTTTATTTTTTSKPIVTTTKVPIVPVKGQEDETSQLLQLLSLLQQQQIPQTTEAITSTTTAKFDEELLKNLALLDNLLSPTAKTMIKEAVDLGTTENIKAAKNPSGGSNGEGLSDADLKAIYMLLDAMSSTTAKPSTTTTTTRKPAMHPALQNMLTMLNNPWSDIQKMRAQQSKPSPSLSFPVPQPPKPVPTTSSLDLLSQLFNLSPSPPKPQTEKPQDFGIGSLLGSLLPKRPPTNREATSGSNQLLNFFQPEQPVATPPSGPYYWFDVNAFLGNDPTAGPMSGFRPKMGTRDYFIKVRRRRNSAESYY